VGYAEENEEWIRRRGSLEVYRDLPRLSPEEIIEKSDAVLVETDVWDLADTARRCVDAGKHIHLDKPFPCPPETYRQLLGTAEKKGLTVQLGYMYRYNPAVMKVIEWAKEGRFGEIYAINAEMSTFHSAGYRTWLKNFGGGIQFILGSHLADLIVYLLGKPLRVTSFLQHSGRDGVDLPDNDLSVLEYEKALARIFVSSVEINGYGRRQFVVTGSLGSADILPLEPPQMTWSDLSIADYAYRNDRVPVPLETNGKRYDRMMQDFAAYVRGEKENPFSFAHELAVQEVLDRMVGGVRMLGKAIV
jgi:predicted dehydrogenase